MPSGVLGVAGFRVAGEVVKRAIVTDVGLVVGCFQVLGAGNKLNSGIPIEFRLFAVGIVLGDVAGESERLDGEVGIREV